jgi:two-component system, response regulator YesN
VIRATGWRAVFGIRGTATGQRWSTPGAHREIWQAATSYIDQHVAERLTLGELAHVALTSERQLQRVFAAMGATTVRDYIVRTRMRRAAALMLTTDEPVSTVAGQVGYGAVSAFIKAFRLHHGVTPNELRRRVRR